MCRFQKVRLRSLLYSLTLLLQAGEISTAPTGKPALRWEGHWKGEGLREQLVVEVLEDFRYLHQDIDVQFSFAKDVLPEKTQDHQSRFIADMIRSGTNSWDVIWLDSVIYQKVSVLLDDPLWGKKHLMDFSPVRKIRDAHRPELLQSPDFCESTGGLLTGPYIEGFLYCTWYNAELAGQLGLNIKKEEMSLEDLLEYLRCVNAFNTSADQPISAFADFSRSGSFARLTHNLFLSTNPDLSSPASVSNSLKEILYALEAIGRQNPVQHQKNLQWEDAARLLAENRALFLFDSTWRYSAFQAFSPDLTKKLRLAQMPGIQKQKFYCGGFMPAWAVMKNSPAKEAATQLMEFWSKPEIVEKWTRYSKMPSGMVGSLYDPEYGNDSFAAFQRTLMQGRVLRRDFFAQQQTNRSIYPILRYIDDLIYGQITADDAIEHMKGVSK
ncbi:ABC transporter substrate-binding protein [Tichowtungia aerotolerans]|uniref:Extracellular solute-binding protein n=1 Tax=Tichowtungia aerotolerans TaxID=2697043 RepID=A0A6P1M9N9_9BACT|nr:ABC transporter substrate-binding protein [Tichowtungia aerotolerans]QHI70637.1 extracellular solute-binding protein [Tichowtungia aerotolerans]